MTTHVNPIYTNIINLQILMKSSSSKDKPKIKANMCEEPNNIEK